MIAKSYAVNWVVFGEAQNIEADSPQAAFDRLMTMQNQELIQRSPDRRVKADVLWENDMTGENERLHQDKATECFLNSRSLAENSKVKEAKLKLNQQVEKETKKQRGMKAGLYDVGWIAWGEISHVAADSESDAAEKVEEMSLHELIERSDDPTLEAEVPGQTPGWWRKAKIQTFGE